MKIDFASCDKEAGVEPHDRGPLSADVNLCRVILASITRHSSVLPSIAIVYEFMPKSLLLKLFPPCLI